VGRTGVRFGRIHSLWLALDSLPRSAASFAKNVTKPQQRLTCARRLSCWTRFSGRSRSAHDSMIAPIASRCSCCAGTLPQKTPQMLDLTSFIYWYFRRRGGMLSGGAVKGRHSPGIRLARQILDSGTTRADARAGRSTFKGPNAVSGIWQRWTTSSTTYRSAGGCC
jgi:hypothetical protein